MHTLEQLPLPGTPPAEDQATPEDTARVQLMFESDDNVLTLVVKAMNSLFFAPKSATFNKNYSDSNCVALYKRLLEAVEAERQQH